MLDNRKRMYALQSWTVERKAKAGSSGAPTMTKPGAGHIRAQRARASRSRASSNANSSSATDFPPRLLTP
jgi:hypothetical protein